MSASRNVRRLSPLALVLILSLMLLSACGASKGSSSDPSAGTPKSGAADPAAASELRIAIAGEGDTLDPAHFSLVTSFSIASNIYSALVRYKPGTIEPMPDLAETWDTSEDGKTWTFHLRQGVKWHDGYGELTARDVVESYQRVKDDATASRWKGELRIIDSIEASDDHTVVFNLNQPSGAFLHTVVAFRQGFITKTEAVAKFGEDYGRHPVGTGAYMLEKWAPGSEVVLKANPDFYLGKPEIETVRFMVIPDETVRMLALEKGEVDIAMALTNPEVRKNLEANPNIELGEVASASMHGIRLNFKVKPFDDPRVREAMFLAIDREGIAEVIMGGMAAPAYSELAPPYLGHTEDVPRYAYDPARAKQLLAEAGYPNGFATELIWLNTINKEILSTLLANWKVIGVDVKAAAVDGGTWVQSLGKGEAPMGFFAATRSDPHVFYSTFFHSDAFPPGLNSSWYDGVDALIEAGGQEMNQAKRAPIYAQVQKQIMTDLPILPIYWPKHAHPYASYVKGWDGRQNYDAWAFPVSIKR
jgi:peptide/nickel transport system substrate-binding protein